MSDETGEIPGGEVVSYATDSEAPLTVEEAARELAADREKALNPTAESAKPEKAATAETELPDEGNAAAGEDQPTGETQEADPAERPPLELPRSWTKDRTEHWNKLDPDTQEFLLEQDRKASAEVRRVQNEAAEKLKGLTAKEQQVEQVRQQFDTKIKSALAVLEREQLRDFPDIKTWDDVKKMQRDDPFRYQEWDVHQKELALVNAEATAAEARQTQEHNTNWTQHVQAENALAAEHIPDLADKVKGPALMTRAAERLAELGFKTEELNDLASGKSKLSIYDHRLQQLIFSDLKLSDIQKAKTAASAKTLPPVQRPGTSKPANSGAATQIQALEKQLSSASGDRAARISAEIWRLEKKVASR